LIWRRRLINPLVFQQSSNSEKHSFCRRAMLAEQFKICALRENQERDKIPHQRHLHRNILIISCLHMSIVPIL